MTPINQIMRANGGEFSLGASLGSGFRLAFRHWKIWSVLGLIVAIAAWFFFYQFLRMFFSIFENMDPNKPPSSGYQIYLDHPQLMIFAISFMIVGVLLMPFVYNVAYHSLFKDKVGWGDLFDGIPYLRVLGACILVLLITTVLSFIPWVGGLLSLIISPFFLFLPYSAIEGRAFSEALKLTARHYFPLLGLYFLIGIVGAVGCIIFPIMFGPFLASAVAYGMIRSQEENRATRKAAI
ncbi:MAG: hypothetical protein Q3962_01125 [Corynebacterium sp.]|nr:hypothetical protein [Corynebacterium sp.]